MFFKSDECDGSVSWFQRFKTLGHFVFSLRVVRLPWLSCGRHTPHLCKCRTARVLSCNVLSCLVIGECWLWGCGGDGLSSASARIFGELMLLLSCVLVGHLPFGPCVFPILLQGCSFYGVTSLSRKFSLHLRFQITAMRLHSCHFYKQAVFHSVALSFGRKGKIVSYSTLNWLRTSLVALSGLKLLAVLLSQFPKF